MPFALIFIGLILIVTGLEGTEKDLGAQLKTDFSGQGSYLYWGVAIVAAGSVGYIDSLKRFSDTFMALLLISLLLHNGGVFSNLVSGLKSGVTNPETLPADSNASPSGGGSGGGSTGGASSGGSSSGGGSSAASIAGNVIGGIISAVLI